MPTETDACRKVAVPKRHAAVSWDNERHPIAAQAGNPDAGSFDLLCRLNFNAAVLIHSQLQVAAVELPLPPLAEQTRIVVEVKRRWSVVEELEAVVSANLRRATRLRQSILQ